MTDRMSGAELSVYLTGLGLTQKALGAYLEVRADTVRDWVNEKEPVPYRVGDAVQALEGFTASAVGQVVQGMQSAADVGVITYRTDADMWAERPAFKPLPASWWEMVCYRAGVEVPGLEVAYRPAGGGRGDSA